MGAKVHRAVLARDAYGHVRVLATDSALISHEIDVLSSDAAELGMVDDVEPGLWLWLGTVDVTSAGYHDQPDEYVTEYKGDLIDILDPTRGDLAAVADLLAMAPPEPEIPEDDREDIQPGDAHYHRPA